MSAEQKKQTLQHLLGESETRKHPELTDDGELVEEMPTLASLLKWDNREDEDLDYKVKDLLFRGEQYLRARSVHRLVVFARLHLLLSVLMGAGYVATGEIAKYDQHRLLVLVAVAILGVIGTGNWLMGDVMTGSNFGEQVFSFRSETYHRETKQRFLALITKLKLSQAQDYSFNRITNLVAEKIGWQEASLRDKSKTKLELEVD